MVSLYVITAAIEAPDEDAICRAAVLHEAVDWQRAAADAVKGHQVLPGPCSVAQKVEDFLALGKVIDEPMVRRPSSGGVVTLEGLSVRALTLVMPRPPRRGRLRSPSCVTLAGMWWRIIGAI
jgi:hypothetical protein